MRATPTFMAFNLGGDDGWLRAQIRGDATVVYEPPVMQYVILEHAEVERTHAAFTMLKYKRGKPYGGSEYRATRIAHHVKVQP